MLKCKRVLLLVLLSASSWSAQGWQACEIPHLGKVRLEVDAKDPFKEVLLYQDGGRELLNVKYPHIGDPFSESLSVNIGDFAIDERFNPGYQGEEGNFKIALHLPTGQLYSAKELHFKRRDSDPKHDYLSYLDASGDYLTSVKLKRLRGCFYDKQTSSDLTTFRIFLILPLAIGNALRLQQESGNSLSSRLKMLESFLAEESYQASLGVSRWSDFALSKNSNDDWFFDSRADSLLKVGFDLEIPTYELKSRSSIAESAYYLPRNLMNGLLFPTQGNKSINKKISKVLDTEEPFEAKDWGSSHRISLADAKVAFAKIREKLTHLINDAAAIVVDLEGVDAGVDASAVDETRLSQSEAASVPDDSDTIIDDSETEENESNENADHNRVNTRSPWGCPIL